MRKCCCKEDTDYLLYSEYDDPEEYVRCNETKLLILFSVLAIIALIVLGIIIKISQQQL